MDNNLLYNNKNKGQSDRYSLGLGPERERGREKKEEGSRGGGTLRGISRKAKGRTWEEGAIRI